MPMHRHEIIELISNGENSGVEFKEDSAENFRLAQEVCAFANLMGGVILFGVADNGEVRGISSPRFIGPRKLEEWVMELCRTKIDPPIIPYLEMVKEVEPGKDVAAIRIPQGPNKPYARIHDHRRTYFIRVGSTSREAGKDELERLFQTSGHLRYGQKPVPGASLSDLDFARLESYFKYVLRQKYPDRDRQGDWAKLLTNLELAVLWEGQTVPSVDGLLLFGKNTKRFLPQSGIRAIANPEREQEYSTIADQDLVGPLVPLYGPRKTLLETGTIEQTLDFIGRYAPPEARIVRGRRIQNPAYPEEVLREVVVNAVAHRDYAIAGAEIMLNIFPDRLEVISPGRLPNSATVDAIKSGFRYSRNQVLVNVLRDYGYIDARGMGIHQKMIPGMMKHNKTEPEFIVTDFNFTVRLWREKKT